MRIAPGSTIGIIGGGQLGRMLAIAAAQLGYRVHVFAPDEQPVAAAVAAAFTRAEYADERALAEFAEAVDIATYEFENLPAGPLASLGAKLLPGVGSLCVAQDRAEEKAFIERCGGVVAPWRTVDSLADLDSAVAALGLPLVLKSRRLGYDGKGQAWLRTAGEAAQAWHAIGEQPAVAEAAIEFLAEFSVILARTGDGKTRFWDSPDNRHEDGILRRSTLPAGPEIEAQVGRAREMAQAIAEDLDHVGVLTVEFFACRDGPIVNEIAPRVHNSGHWTIEGAETSQFEQHIRAICGLPLGPTRRTGNFVEMRNLIGDDVGDWLTPLEEGTHLHIYGKGGPRTGRKMGHVTRVERRP